MALNAKPSVGLEFDSVDTTWQFWVEYGKKCGFGVRNDYLNKRKVDGLITSGRFVCSKEGSRLKDKRSSLVKKPRADTRSGCPVRISFRLRDGKYVIHEFEETHNHLLQHTETTHMLASHRKISEVQAYEIEMAEESGLMQKSSFQLMSTQAGGRANLGFTRLDVKNYLKARRQRSMVYGEVGSLMQYFQHQMLDNPSFYHAYQMDCDEQITNIFWADARMILDYGYFGDVVSLDTTYCTNRANRPLALFSGFNHYRGTILFGAALLYDETADSFKWLFETFLEARGNKKPQTLFTDQAQAMAKALVEVMPETRHGLCTSHLMQNGIKHLGCLMKGGSDLLFDFKKCMYEYDQEVKFEAAWSKLVAKFDLFDNNWVKSMYGIKQKWASCHMNKAITLGMRSTQLRESLNSSFKACMRPGISVIQLFQHFDKVVEEKRYNELVCEYESRHKLPRIRYQHSPILMQLAQVYTHKIFDMFNDEFSLFLAASKKSENLSQLPFEYVITMFEVEGEWTVLFDPTTFSISCTCKKFETFGILCCHALKVIEANDVKLIPNQYILKRWTRDARDGVIIDHIGNEVVDDPKLFSTHRYKRLCSTMIRLAAGVSTSEYLHKLVEKGLYDLCKLVMEARLREIENADDEGDVPTVTKEYETQAKGFKIKPGLQNRRRLKSCVELMSKKKSKATIVKPTPRQRSKDRDSLSQMESGTSTLAQSACELSQTSEDNFSFTRLLMEPLNDG